MKPTDLRLGNYVRIKDNNTIAKVEAISRKKVRFFYGGDKSRSYFRKYSEIEPVLIYDIYHILDCETCWHGETREDSLYSLPLIGFDYKFRYLHELQNIHDALTGDELKIEL